ncbi:spore germination protein GerPC [Bacillus sp. FJAT-45350]|uniref:spore germination protein GerPC n=1 Tax=Bacillus sp. FJAT-45350 TaxID=2011014 RepID=UPI000BB8FA9F|nr:spore germination protein GerPC [Bacillus sp. FJAT-45350]
MYYPNQHNHYSHIENNQNIYDYFHSQEEKISRLENVIHQLQNEINMIKSHPPSVNYKFDQLKVERLEGTLNIGLSPNHAGGENSIEDFNVNQDNQVLPSVNNPNPYPKIKHEINEYLNGECYQILESIEQKYNYQLDLPYRQFIISDVKNQIDNRITHYLNQIPTENMNEQQLLDVEQRTTSKLKEDINKTFEEFIRHLPREGY